MRSYSKLKVFSIIGLISVGVAGYFLSLPTLATSEYAVSQDVNFTVYNNGDPVIELNVPSKVALDLSPTSGRAFNVQNLEIGVGTNSSDGYRLFMSAQSDILTRTSSIQDRNGNVFTPTILPMTTTGNATGYTDEEFESMDTDSDTLNRWGYKLSTENKYLPMSEGIVQIAHSVAPSNLTGQEAVLNFAAKVDTTQPAGTYATSLLFTAIVNVVADTCNPSGDDISSIICMQDINENNKTSIKNSMVEDHQYTLRDSRDNKMYYVSKLADGNVWMTQNLDFDIVAGTTYTNEDTDIGWNSSTNSYDAASWAPGSSAATHVTSDTNLTFSDTDPQSYDPGNLCWDGKIRFSGDYTLSNTTEECNSDNVHYHIGNYYNWTAAIAMDNSDDYITDNEDVNRSICPAGWMLPKSGTVQTGPGSFYHLKNQLGLTSDDGGKNTPVFFTYGGFWDANSYAVGNSYGYWSSVVKNISSSYYLYFAVHLLLDPVAESFGRGQYYSVRCLAR